MIKKLRLDERRKVECGKVQEDGPKKKSLSIPRPEARGEENSANYPQSTRKKRKSKFPSMNDVNASVQE